MKMKVYAKGRTYNVQGVLDEDFRLILKKGGKISPKAGTSISGKVRLWRENSEFVTSDGVIKKDIQFKSVSTAACFVTGTMSNGFKVWRYEKDNKLIKRVGCVL